MRRITTAAVSAALLLVLTGCSGEAPTTGRGANPEACKAALAERFDAAMAKEGIGSPPPACAGLASKTLERITGEVMKDWMASPEGEKYFEESFEQGVEDAIGSATPDPTTADISDECRSWIEDELLDSSDSVEATAGQNACSDLSDEEMDQAIEQVTDELIKQGATTP